VNRFDLVSYARERRLRLRDLHDGNPVPPVFTRAKPRYRSSRDSDPAIVCRYGYVHAEPPGLGWAAFFKSARGLRACLGQVEKIDGVRILQVGDSEAAGWAPVEAVERLLEILVVRRRRPPAPGRPAEQMAALARKALA
jgi:hypothetical protein